MKLTERELQELVNKNNELEEIRYKEYSEKYHQAQLVVRASKWIEKPRLGLFHEKCPKCGKSLKLQVFETGMIREFSKTKFYSCACGYEYATREEWSAYAF